MLKSKILLNIFYPLNLNFNDIQKFNAEIAFTPSCLELSMTFCQEMSTNTPQPLYNTFVGVHSINHVS